jgi:hypothetical protein
MFPNMELINENKHENNPLSLRTKSGQINTSMSCLKFESKNSFADLFNLMN